MKKVWLAGTLTAGFAALMSLVGTHSGGIAAPTTGLGNSKAIENASFYEVSGASLEELRTDVYARGPYDRHKGQRYAGWAEWRIEWRFERDMGPKGCAISDATTETHVDYTLPRWADAHRAPPEAQESWNRFIKALTLHEEGHGQLARELAQRIEVALRSLPPEHTCTALDQTANGLARRMIAEDKTQEEYDRLTGHGHTQGAAFPAILVRADP